MTKSKTRIFWITSIVFAFIISGALFFSQTNTVRALFSNDHIFEVLFRFWNEVLSKSEAGRYYQNLAEKHADELFQILGSHTEHTDKDFLPTIQIFIPGLEALVNGEGDTVQITEEQISSLEAELDWIYSLASPPLQEDIEKEQQRFPLENFIGMTMKEALDYVNSNWETGTQVIPLATPTLMPVATAAHPICLIGPDSDCLEKPTLIPDSNGLWASYVLNGVYFEYPDTWKIQGYDTQPQNTFFMVPAPGSPEADHMLTLHLFADLNLLQVIKENNLLEAPETILMRPSPIWKQSVTFTDFQGVEFFWIDTTGYLEVFLYNEQDQIVVDMMAIFDNDTVQIADDPSAVEKTLPNIQHIIESIRIWKP